MSDKTVKVRLEAVTSQYSTAMSRAGQSTSTFVKGLGTDVAKGVRSLETVQREADITGAALLGIGVASVGAAARFDKQMSAVRAATKASAATMDSLRQSALDAGAATVFSATEAAQGQEELAKAGISTANILGGALTGALDLAAAGGVSVANAAETGATALKVFGLRGSEMTHVADLLAAGAGKAQGSVDDMGMALKQSALVAKQTGLSVDDTTGALAQFASAGLLGSDAGTSFKTMLQRLTPQSQEAADLMSQLGINAYDAQGRFIGLEAYAGKLRSGLMQLTPEARNAALATLFGSDAVRAAAVLYEGGAEGVRKWRNAVNDSGYASEQAAIRLDNLAGDFEQLSGSIETTFIKSGSNANSALRLMTKAATGAVNAVGNLPAPLLGVGVAGAAAAGGFLLLAPRVAESVDAFRRLEKASPRAAGAIGKAGKVAGTAAAAFAALEVAVVVLDKIYPSAVNGGKGVNELSRELRNLGQFNLKPDSLGFVSKRGEANSLNEALTYLTDHNWGMDFQESIVGVFGASTDLTAARDAVRGVDAALAAMVSDGNVKEAAAAFSKLRAEFIAGGGDAAKFDAQFTGYRDALAGVEDAATGAAGANGDVAQAIAAADDAAKAAESAIKDLEDAMDRLRGGAQSADEATADLEKSFADAADAAKGMKGAVTAGGKSLDLTSEAGRKAQGALGGIADALFAAIPAWKANSDSAKTVQGRVLDARIEFIRQAQQMGLTKDAAKKLADQYGLIPSEILTKYTTPGADAAVKAAEAAAAAIAKIPRNVPVRIRISQDGKFTTGQGQSTRPGTAAGGYVYGPGPSNRDSFLQPMANGEFVTNAAVAQSNKPLMTAINDARFADAFVYLGAKVGAQAAGGGGSLNFGDITVIPAPGERVTESLPRALHRAAFELGFGG